MRNTSGINPTVIFVPESKYKLKQKRVESRFNLSKNSLFGFFFPIFFPQIYIFLSLKKKVLD